MSGGDRSRNRSPEQPEARRYTDEELMALFDRYRDSTRELEETVWWENNRKRWEAPREAQPPRVRPVAPEYPRGYTEEELMALFDQYTDSTRELEETVWWENNRKRFEAPREAQPPPVQPAAPVRPREYTEEELDALFDQDRERNALVPQQRLNFDDFDWWEPLVVEVMDPDIIREEEEALRRARVQDEEGPAMLREGAVFPFDSDDDPDDDQVNRSPRIDPDHPYNLDRDVKLLQDDDLAAGVPHFQDFVDREDWIRENLLLDLQQKRDEQELEIERRRATIRNDPTRPDILRYGTLTEEQERQRKGEEALLAYELEDESSEESGFAGSSRSATPSPDRLQPDEAYSRRTFEPYDRPTRPAEFLYSDYVSHGFVPPYDRPYYVVMVGEIDPDFQNQRGDVIITHPAQMVRGRRFPITGYIHVVRGPEDFPNLGIVHGDLSLRIGSFNQLPRPFLARPNNHYLFNPLNELMLHSYVDLSTRTNVDQNRYRSIPAKLLGLCSRYYRKTVRHLPKESVVRQLEVGTICTNIFRPHIGDVIILPMAWEDNFDHSINFRRSMCKWYMGPQRSEKYIIPGIMMIRHCVDREIRGRMYVRPETGAIPSPRTHITDRDYNWGYAELFSWDGTDWFYWGRDKMHPTFASIGRIPKCVRYCPDQ